MGLKDSFTLCIHWPGILSWHFNEVSGLFDQRFLLSCEIPIVFCLMKLRDIFTFLHLAPSVPFNYITVLLCRWLPFSSPELARPEPGAFKMFSYEWSLLPYLFSLFLTILYFPHNRSLYFQVNTENVFGLKYSIFILSQTVCTVWYLLTRSTSFNLQSSTKQLQSQPTVITDDMLIWIFHTLTSN